MNLRQQIEAQESHFSQEQKLLGERFNSVGYHSRIPSGTWVHMTRTNIYYALALLELGDAASCERAAEVIGKVLPFQVTDPCDPAYGIWPWCCEEPVPMMAPPDWNWADFIGAALCHMLAEYRARLDDATANDVAAALERAAWSIFRRNMQPHYTNISIMGAAVTGCAGELLGIPLLDEYAARRLEAFLAYTKMQGGLNEYNSPTYTFVALHEAERILQLVKANRRLVAAAQELHAYIWGEIACRFHPATGQLAGPQSRAYSEYLQPRTAAFLSEATGVGIEARTDSAGVGLLSFHYDGIRHLPCPEKWRGRFAALPEAEQEIRQRFVQCAVPEKDFIGTTYLTPEMTLGSINRECFWTQRRPLLGYWLSGKEKPAMFRMRFLKNGKDFASAGVRMAQEKNKVVFALNMLTDRGDWHIGLRDFEEDAFCFSRLALRFELVAEDAELLDGQTMKSGAFRVVVHGLFGIFDGEPVDWISGRDHDRVWVEAVLYNGPEKSSVFDETLQTSVGGGVEILAESALKSAPPNLRREEKRYRVEWGDLNVEINAFAEPYD